MALLTVNEARTAGQTKQYTALKTADSVLVEAASTYRTSFDIFISHSSMDAEIVLGVKRILENMGKSVYVDWVNDPNLNRSNVTPETAEKLRIRMKQCSSMFYLHSSNATKSRWMPWELGFFDGYNGNVAIMPLATNTGQSTYKGEEFLGVYPYVDITNGVIFIQKDSSKYDRFDKWVISPDKLRPVA